MGLEQTLHLGNLDARRDWGHARDYVEAQWLMLQAAVAADYVIATGQQHSVRDFVVMAGRELGMDIRFSGSGTDERGIDAKSGRTLVRVDPRYFRPAEVETLLGDASKARRELGWQPRIAFPDLVAEMVANDLKLAERDAMNLQHGYKVANSRE